MATPNITDQVDDVNVTDLFADLNLKQILTAIIAFAIIILLAKGVRKLSDKIENELPGHRLLSLQISTIFTFIIYIFGTIGVVFAILKPPEKLLIGLGGSAAVAIGFALKDIAGSIIAGVTLLFDRPFQVGDRVQFGDTYGEISNIGLRAVRLVTLDDNLVTIPNNKFMSDVVASGNAGALDMMICCEFHLDISANLKLAQKIIKEVIYTSRFAFLKKPVGIVIKECHLSHTIALVLTSKAYVIDVRFEKAFQTDIITRVTEAFNKHKIKRPQSALNMPPAKKVDA